jgi:hypothetical protein
MDYLPIRASLSGGNFIGKSLAMAAGLAIQTLDNDHFFQRLADKTEYFT